MVEHPPERIITAAGVSSGIGMALRLAELLTDTDTAQAMQLMVEYDPQPPFDAASIAEVGPEVLARAIGLVGSRTMAQPGHGRSGQARPGSRASVH